MVNTVYCDAYMTVLPNTQRVRALCIVLFVLSVGIVGAQEVVYEVHTINYSVEGITRGFVLEQKLEGFAVGSQYTNQEELDAAINEQIRIIRNLRQIETVEIEYTTTQDTSRILVDVLISIVDSGNFVALPKPQFSTDGGWELGVRLIDYNFLGSLQQLNIRADLILPTDNKNRLSINPNFRLPFQAFDHSWYWQPNLAVDIPLYDGIEDLDIAFGNTVGITLNLFSYQWILAYTQDIDFSADPSEDIYLLGSTLTFGTTIYTAVINDFLGRLRYTPSLSVGVQYRFEQPVTDPEDRGFDFGLNHSIGFNRVQWQENLRDGFIIRLINRNTYNTFMNELNSSIELESRAYVTYDILGISGRIGTRYFFPISAVNNNAENNAGGYIRGVLDDNTEGNIIVYANFDITLAGFKNGNAVEAQGSLFVDGVIAIDSARPFDPMEDMRLSVGFEGIGFLLRSRSVFMRFSAGVDALRAIRNRALFEDGNLEIFFGFGHHY